MQPALVSLALLLCLAFAASPALSYNQVAYYAGDSFFDNFNFWSDDDPTHGYVDYTTRDQAQQWGLINTNNGQVYIGADSSTVSSGRGRAAVRLQSNATFTNGLFVLDLNHMPEGCGTWPAFWLCGPNWPNGGEIDIIEGVNNNQQDQTTLHTSAGCTMDGQSGFNGYWTSTDCEGNNGCGIVENGKDYGSSLNNEGGGVYATQWTNDVIQSWYFNHNNVPQDLKNGTPNPSAWGTPYAKFQLGGNCPSSHFYSHQIIINLTFCGDWAGNVFGSQCPGMGDCNSYVQNNPSAFADAYWIINSVTVYQ